jgi:hypothetical protein
MNEALLGITIGIGGWCFLYGLIKTLTDIKDMDIESLIKDIEDQSGCAPDSNEVKEDLQ